MQRVSLVTILSVLSLFGATHDARADKRERAREHFVAGKAHYAAKRYRDAINAFERAGKILPSPLLDYNIARSYEGLKRPKKAISYYSRYLRRRPRAKNRAVVEARLKRLRRQIVRPGDPYEDLEGARPDGDHRAATVAPVAPATPLGAPESRPASASPLGAPETQPAAATSRPAEAGGPRAVAGASPGPLSSRPAASRPTGGPDPVAPAAAGPFDKPKRSPARPRKEVPLYRQWWFWATIGAGALIATFIIVTTASADSGTPASGSRGLSIAF